VSTQLLDFIGSAGQKLSGRIELPQGRPRGWALFAHCFTGGKDSVAAVRVARALASVGIGTMRFDFTGLGESEGDFATSGFSANVEDLVAAAGAMADGGMPVSLLNPVQFEKHSFGGRLPISGG
jgi:alpha/beta superfamily hydrolase